jgi:hypothetical protein
MPAAPNGCENHADKSSLRFPGKDARTRKGTPKLFERVFDTEIRVARGWGTPFAPHDARKMGRDAKGIEEGVSSFFLGFFA